MRLVEHVKVKLRANVGLGELLEEVKRSVTSKYMRVYMALNSIYEYDTKNKYNNNNNNNNNIP